MVLGQVCPFVAKRKKGVCSCLCGGVVWFRMVLDNPRVIERVFKKPSSSPTAALTPQDATKDGSSSSHGCEAKNSKDERKEEEEEERKRRAADEASDGHGFDCVSPLTRLGQTSFKFEGEMRNVRSHVSTPI